MATPKQMYYEKRAECLIKNLNSRHFDAFYCATKEEALEKALSLIPTGSRIGWGGATTAQQIGLIDAVSAGDAYRAEGREYVTAPDVFITGANALSLDGQMVNIDGFGNRISAIIFGPKTVLVIAGMNKVEEDLDAAIRRARTVAAPINEQRFLGNTPCAVTGICADCKSEDCICNHILVTRHCRPSGRIKFILVGEELGF